MEIGWDGTVNDEDLVKGTGSPGSSWQGPER